jgi:hypothetical protein
LRTVTRGVVELTVAVPSKNSNSVVMLSPFVWGVVAPVVEGHTSTEERGEKSSHRAGEMSCGCEVSRLGLG